MLKYWIWLTTRNGVGAAGVSKLLRRFGTPQAVYLAQVEEYRAEGFSQPSLLEKDLIPAEEILYRCYETGVFLLTMQDAAYPQRLLSLDDPPAVLYGKGMMPDFNGPAIGVVGTRRASTYGLQQARRMSRGLSAKGCMVVSGGAAGVDTQALWGALEGGGPTVAVLGSGVDVVYPTENADLFREILTRGCLLSEYPPGTPIRRTQFPARNRIISGLSMGVLVVEAPERSGAMITACRALEQGREVFALPANLDRESAGGNLRLLRDGAVLVTEPMDILQEYAGRYPRLLKEEIRSPLRPVSAREPAKKPIDKEKTSDYIDAKKPKVPLTTAEEQLLRLLAQGPAHIDTLSAQMQQPAGSVLAQVTLLEVKGYIRRLPGQRFALTEA